MSVDIMMELWEGAACLKEAFKNTSSENTDDTCSAFKYVREGEVRKLWAGGSRVEKQPEYWKDIQLDAMQMSSVEYFKPNNWQICSKIASEKDIRFWDSCSYCIGELFPRILVPPTYNMFFNNERNKHSKEHRVLWTTFMIYDEKCVHKKDNEHDSNEHVEKGAYFLRTIRDLGTEGDQTDDLIFLLLYRLPELTEIDSDEHPCVLRTRDPEKEKKKGMDHQWIADLSSYMRKTEEPNYVLVRSSYTANENVEYENNVGAIYCGEIWDNPEVQRRAKQIRGNLINRFKDIKKIEFMSIDSFLDLSILANKGDEQSKIKIDIIHEVNDIVKRSLFEEFNEKENPDEINQAIDCIIKQLENRIDESDLSELKSIKKEIANYFVWLACVNEKIQTYYVRHVNDFRFQGTDGRAYRQAFKPSGIVIASTDPVPSKDIAAKADLLINTILAPLNDYYAIQNLGVQQVAMYAKGASHTLKNSLATPGWRLNELISIEKEWTTSDNNFSWYSQIKKIDGNIANKTKDGFIQIDVINQDFLFLQRQANILFWVMYPNGLDDDLKKKPPMKVWTIEEQKSFIVRAIANSLMKVRLSVLNLSADKLTEMVRNVLAVNTDYSDQLGENISDKLENKVKYNISLVEINLPTLDYYIFESILYELIVNASSRAMELSNIDKSLVDMKLSVIDNKIELKITNSSCYEDCVKLQKNWKMPIVYEEKGSGGVRGLFQMQLLENKFSKLCKRKLRLTIPSYIKVNGTESCLVDTGITIE